MTLTHVQQRVAPTERVAVRCVDSDVHPVPRRGMLQQYIPEPIRSKYFMNHRVGEQIYYDAPDYAHAYAMRVDTFPDDGEFACSDPDLAFRQPIMEAGADIAILEPAGYCRTRRPTPQQTYGDAITPGRPSTGWTARTTGTSGGAARSAWPSRIRRARPARSRSGPSTPTWRRS